MSRPSNEAAPQQPPHRTPLLEGALRLVRYSFLTAPRATAFTLLTSLAGSLAEGLGLLLLLPLLASAGMNFGGSSGAGRITTLAHTALVHTGVPQPLWLPVVLGAFLLVAASRSMLRRLQATLLYTSTNTVQLALSRRLYAAVIHAQWAFLVRQRGGSFTHLLTEQLSNVAEAIALLLNLINLLLVALLYLAFALRLSAPMTLLVLAVGAIVMVLQRSSLGRTRASADALSRSIGDVYIATEEHLLNLKSVKTYDAEARELQSYSELCRAVVRNSVATARHQAAAAFQFELGSLIAFAAVIFLAFGIFRVPGATMLLLLGIFTRLMPQLAGLQTQAHQFAAALPSYEHLLGIEAECIAHAEPPVESVAPSALRLTRELRVENLSFRYPADPSSPHPNPEVLRHVDLCIPAGRVTALTGPSGSGKSTLADILTGLLTPTSGRILLDGAVLSPSDLRHWRTRIGYVGQETVLFHQSIRENLLWACPEASPAELHRALELAAATFVYELPRGLDTVAGDRGILLSSGQRQRLALARALLRNPSLLVLDEATNALDTENEARILDALLAAVASLNGRLTILMIAHRPSALRRAEKIIELHNGGVAIPVSP